MSDTLLARILGFELWRYDDNTALEKLYRHYKIATWIIIPWVWAGGAFAFSLLQMAVLQSLGLFDYFGWIDIVIMAVSTAVSAVLVAPALIANITAKEIERQLRRRKEPLPGNRSIVKRALGSLRKATLFYLLAFGIMFYL